MPRSQRPRKARAAFRTHGDRALCMTQPHRAAQVFRPLDELLASILATGEAEFSGAEAVIRTERDCADLQSAVNGVIEHCRLWHARRNRDFDAPHLRKLVARINAAMPFAEADLRAAQFEIDGMRGLCNRMTIGEARELVGIVQARQDAGAPMFARISKNVRSGD